VSEVGQRRAALICALIGGAPWGLGCDRAPCEARAGAVCPVAGTGALGFNGDGLAPTATDLYLVSVARRGPDGRLYVMDFNNQRIRRIGDDGLMETVIGNGDHWVATVGVPATATPLENPIDMRFMSDGRLVFVSYHDPRVLVLTPEGTLETIAGAADGVTGLEGDEGDGGPALAALFIQLDGIAVAPDDTIYVSDSRARRVRRIRGGTIETVAGDGNSDFYGDGGPGTAAAMRWPSALELDAAGNLYIADAINHAVRRLAVDGTITTVVGDGIEGDRGDGGPASAARLRQPLGVALDAQERLYVADRGNFRIRRVSAEGIIETIAGAGVEGDAGDGGPAIAAEFGYLSRIAIDEADEGALLVADQSNARVRRVSLR
jgi:sugar lactone lactonase YvrE